MDASVGSAGGASFDPQGEDNEALVEGKYVEEKVVGELAEIVAVLLLLPLPELTPVVVDIDVLLK